MSKIKKISFIFLISFMLGNVGLWSAPLLNASEVEERAQIEVMQMSEEEYGALVNEVNNEYGTDFEAEGRGKERAIGIGVMIAGLYKAWKTCSMIALGMGMPGCGSIIAAGYQAIKIVYNEIYG